MYNNLGSITYVNNSKYAKSSGNSVEGIETLGSSNKDSENVKNKLADLRPNVSGVKVLSISDVTVLVYYGYYVALANILTAEDL